jgi:hypothetical protein
MMNSIPSTTEFGASEATPILNPETVAPTKPLEYFLRVVVVIVGIVLGGISGQLGTAIGSISIASSKSFLLQLQRQLHLCQVTLRSFVETLATPLRSARVRSY